jgi:hypothetical protein
MNTKVKTLLLRFLSLMSLLVFAAWLPISLTWLWVAESL